VEQLSKMQKQPAGDRTVQERASMMNEFYRGEVLELLHEIQLATIQNELDAQLYQA